MRRKPHVLAIVVGAAAVLLLSAPALGAGVLSTETAALSGPSIQESPAIAINPDVPTSAAVVADEGAPITPVPHATTTSSANWVSGGWTTPAVLPHAGSAPAGQADVAWGVGNDVYAVDVGSSQSTLCISSQGGGVFLWSSSDGGASYDPTPEQINQPASNLSQAIEPAVAVDRDPSHNRIYVAYTRLDYANGNCTGAVTGSRILLGYEQAPGTIITLRTVTPFGLTAHYRSPSIAVLPDSRVIVAFRNDTPTGSTVETEVCDLTASVAHYCGPGGLAVGPSTVLGDATAPGAVSGLAGATTPSVVAAGGRVTVAWHALVGGTVRAFAAMSTDNGATFGPAQQIDPASPGNQVAPRLAADAATGRVDVAYEWDAAGTGTVLATVASAGRPLPGATSEAWAQPVVVEASGAAASSALPDQTALGHRLGIGTAAVPGSPLPATVVAFTDTPGGNQDVHVVGLLHGTSAPTIAAQTVKVSKNATTIVRLSASDPDGDPLTWSVGAQPATPGSSVNASDAARGDFAYVAANRVGTDTFQAIASDGVNQASQTISVNVVNDPPTITCQSLVTHEDMPLVIPVASCVTDPNKDPVTVDLDSATGGTVQRVSGTWSFNPAPKSTAPGSFVMHATDDGGLQAVPVRVTVTIAADATPVTLVVANTKPRVLTRGLALRLSGVALDQAGKPRTISWDFGDKTPPASGANVAHRFRKPGTFFVTATASTAPPVRIKIMVRQPAVEVVGAPSVEDGVMQLRVRTRVAGKLQFRVDSRSQTLSVPSGLTVQTLRMQVTSGPLVRLSLRLTPSKKTLLQALRMRRLVLVSPASAG